MSGEEEDHVPSAGFGSPLRTAAAGRKKRVAMYMLLVNYSSEDGSRTPTVSMFATTVTLLRGRRARQGAAAGVTRC